MNIFTLNITACFPLIHSTLLFKGVKLREGSLEKQKQTALIAILARAKTI